MRRFPRSAPWAVLGVAAIAASALPYAFFTTSQGKNLHWANGYAVMYTSPGYLNAGTGGGIGFRQAAGTWNAVTGSAFRFGVQDGSHAGYGLLPVDDGYNDVQLINLSLGSGVLGITYLYSFGYDGATGNLRDVDVDFTTTEVYDFETVALHEQGHVLGLAHTGDTSAIMFPYYSGLKRSLATDDINGVRALYPVINLGGGGGTPPPPLPGGLPILGGLLGGLTLSSTEVKAGDAVDISCTVTNGWATPLFLQAMYTEPASYGPFPEINVPTNVPYPVRRSLTISEVPGDYTFSATMLGTDGTNNYRAAGTGSATVTVTRDPHPLPLADRMTASLGPSGRDRLELLLARGTKFTLELQGDQDEGMFPGLQVTDPSGRPFAFSPGKTLRAKSSGVHILAVTNRTENRGTYRLFTGAIGKVKAAAKGTVAGGATAEVPLTLFARTAGLLTVKGSKGLDLRIVGLRSPSGDEDAVPPDAEVSVDEVGEDGVWTILVESGTGGTGAFKVGFAGEWIAGDSQTL